MPVSLSLRRVSLSLRSYTPAAVTDEHVQDWRDQLEDEAMPATVNRKLAALSTFFRWAIEAKLITSDPTANINGVEQQAVAPKALSEAAMNKILRKAREGGNLRDHALLELLAATGLRAAEAASLTLGDLSLGERSGWVTVRLGKGRRRRRVPPSTCGRARRSAHIWSRKSSASPECGQFTRQNAIPQSGQRAAHTLRAVVYGEEVCAPGRSGRSDASYLPAQRRNSPGARS